MDSLVQVVSGNPTLRGREHETAEALGFHGTESASNIYKRSMHQGFCAYLDTIWGWVISVIKVWDVCLMDEGHL